MQDLQKNIPYMKKKSSNNKTIKLPYHKIEILTIKMKGNKTQNNKSIDNVKHLKEKENTIKEGQWITLQKTFK